MAELRIQNLQAFAELQSYNNTGKYLYKHPLIKNYSERVQLEEMFRNRSAEFLKQYSLTAENVKRYSSFTKSSKRTPEQKQKDKLNLKRHQEREQLMQKIMEAK